MSGSALIIINGEQVPVNDPHKMFSALFPILDRKAKTVGRGHIAEGRQDQDDLAQEYHTVVFEKVCIPAPTLFRRFQKNKRPVGQQFVAYAKTVGVRGIQMTTRAEKALCRDYQATKPLASVEEGSADAFDASVQASVDEHGFLRPTVYQHKPTSLAKDEGRGDTFFKLDEILRHFKKPNDRKVIKLVIESLKASMVDVGTVPNLVYEVARRLGIGKVHAGELRRDFNALVQEYMNA